MADCNKCIHLPVCNRQIYCVVHGKVICDYFKDDFDSTEVVHGRWIQDGVYDCCSVCNRPTLMPHLKGLPHFKYCPNCGAKMDGDGNG